MLANADTDGIDEMVLFPSFGLCVPTIEDPVLGAGLARMYNQWASEFCAKSGGRLHGVAVVPIEHGDDAITVMEEAKGLGLVATIVPPALKDRNLDHPDMDRFYAAAAALDMPLGVHGAPGHPPAQDRGGPLRQLHPGPLRQLPLRPDVAMTALVSGGVFDRHPTLRVAFLEAGAGWLPWFVERLGEHYESRGDWIPDGWQRPPAEYVAAGNVVVTCEPDERRAAVRGRAARRPVRHVRQRLPPLGRGLAPRHHRVDRARRGAPRPRRTGPGGGRQRPGLLQPAPRGASPRRCTATPPCPP